jgi:hypothetical protein
MNVLKKSAVAACVGVLGLAIVPNSRADVWNKDDSHGERANTGAGSGFAAR